MTDIEKERKKKNGKKRWISKEQGNLIIPLSTTGGAAMAIWDEEEKGGFIDEKLIKLKTEVNPEKIVEIVINLIEKYIESIG